MRSIKLAARGAKLPVRRKAAIVGDGGKHLHGHSHHRHEYHRGDAHLGQKRAATAADGPATLYASGVRRDRRPAIRHTRI